MLGAETATDMWTSWGGLLLQTGAFGLLSIVLLWVVPKELKAQREERQQRDARVDTITNMFAQSLDRAIQNLQIQFDARNNKVVLAIEKQTEQFERALRDNSGRLENALRGKTP